jgi:hypothetical protein
MDNECLICKKHYSQSGKCSSDRKNCLLFEEEPRGKMIRTELTFSIDAEPETPLIKYNSKVAFEDKGKAVEMTIIKINWLDLSRRICNVTAEYHEKEMPYFERKAMFKLVR